MDRLLETKTSSFLGKDPLVYSQLPRTRIFIQPPYGWEISGEIGREKDREGKPVIMAFC